MECSGNVVEWNVHMLDGAVDLQWARVVPFVWLTVALGVGGVGAVASAPVAGGVVPHAADT